QIEAGADFDVGSEDSREALQLGGDRVVAGRHVQEPVIALLIGGARARRRQCGAGRGNRDARKRVPLLAFDVSPNRTLRCPPDCPPMAHKLDRTSALTLAFLVSSYRPDAGEVVDDGVGLAHAGFVGSVFGSTTRPSLTTRRTLRMFAISASGSPSRRTRSASF